MADQVPTTFSIDFSAVPDREAAPAGEYTLEVVGAEMRTSSGEKTGGSQMLFIHWKIVDSDQTAHLFENLIIHPDTMWKVKQCFKALGLIDANGQVQMATDELVGARCRAKVIQEVYAVEQGGDGEVKNRAARYLPLANVAGDAESLTSLFEA
jgi:hypothetical protein